MEINKASNGSPMIKTNNSKKSKGKLKRTKAKAGYTRGTIEEEGNGKAKKKGKKPRKKNITMDAMAKEDEANDKSLGATAEEQIRARGEKPVELKTINETTIRAEWNLDERIKKFLARSKLAKVLKLMAKVDNIQIVSS
eukprot:10047270-Ditylum_brightwellii.AAC.1